MFKQIRAVPYYQTKGCDKFHEFVKQPFACSQLYDINEKIFDGWKGRDMINWIVCKNSDNVIIEFYPDKYTIKSKSTYTLPLPPTIDVFLSDMDRIGIDMFWSAHIVNEQCPRNIMKTTEIQQYYVDLLTRIEKGFEIMQNNNN